MITTPRQPVPRHAVRAVLRPHPYTADTAAPRRRLKPGRTCCGECGQYDACRLHPEDAEAFARVYRAHGFYLDSFTPRRLFDVLQGRTLWFVGDSQVGALCYAVL